MTCSCDLQETLPDLLYRLNNRGQAVFPEFAAAIKPTEFAPGKRFGSGTLSPVDYMLGVRVRGGVQTPCATAGVSGAAEIVVAAAVCF